MKGIRVLLLFFVALTLGGTSTSSGQCNAAFNTIVTPGFTAVQFYDASTGASTWNWNFGDGGTSTAMNPVHNYATTGSYNVCLVISNTTGCTDSTCQAVVIPAQGSCTASFSVQPVAPGFPGFVFTGAGTGGAPLSYSWNFGDGTVLPASPLNTTTYIYQNPGTYNACLTITDANNCTATSCQVVSNGTSSCPPTFISNVTPNSGTVLFLDATFGFDPAVAWTWNFGDGSSSSGSGTATHTYLQSGTYNVCLSIVTQSGCNGSACSTVVVNVPPACNSNFTATTTSNPSAFAFNPSITPASATGIWDFGDGSLPVFGNGTTAQQHTYSASGTYNVCLTVQDGLCIDTFCTTVSVASTASVGEMPNSGRIKTYPNPANETVRIAVDGAVDNHITLLLLDASGRMIRSIVIDAIQAVQVIELDCSGIPSGIYRICLEGGGVHLNAKLAVMH